MIESMVTKFLNKIITLFGNFIIFEAVLREIFIDLLTRRRRNTRRTSRPFSNVCTFGSLSDQLDLSLYPERPVCISPRKS